MSTLDDLQQSPMLCSPEPTSSPLWSNEPTSMSHLSELQQYQMKISQLEEKLHQANSQIEKLQMKVSEQNEEKKNAKAQSRYWTDEEHQRFLEAIDKFGPKDVKSIANYVGSRNATQVRTHAQKYFLRLERENKKKEDRKLDYSSNPIISYDQDRFEVFVSAIKATSNETDMEQRCNIIHERYMPNVSVDDIKAWFFVHTKTVERIQMNEAQSAAKSVGAKRIRSSSNPVSVMSNHRSSSLSTPNFGFESSGSTSLSQSITNPFGSTIAPVHHSSNIGNANNSNNSNNNNNNNNNNITNAPNGAGLVFTQYLFDQKQSKRPQSLPVYNQYPNTYTFDGEQHFFTESQYMVNPQATHQPHQLSHHSQPTQLGHSIHQTNLKPYTPGAPPPLSPAPPPPFIAHFPN